MTETDRALLDPIVSRSNQELPLRDRIRNHAAYRLLAQGQWLKLANFLLACTSRSLGIEKAWHMPYALAMDSTDSCQLSCPFCVGRRKHGQEYINYESFEALLRHLGPWLLKIEFSTSAEPLLHPRICDMIALCKEYGLATSLATNLNHMPEPERLVNSGLDVLMISLDGLTQQTYGRYRIGGSLEKVTANLHRLVQARRKLGSKKPSLVWNYLVFRHNEHEIPQVVRCAKEWGLDYVTFIPPYIPPQHEKEWRSTLPRFREHRWSSQDSGCIWPWGGLLVYPSGQTAVCYLDDHQLCEAQKLPQQFNEIWNGPYLRRVRRAIVSRRSGKADAGPPVPCKTCQHFGQSNFAI